MRYLAFLLMGLAALPAYALTSVNLYKTEVVIDQQQENADAQARARGMQEVIVRATGDKNAAENQVVQKALNKYNQYLNQFSYGQSGDASTITMEFSSPQIRSLLTQAQLPFWPENRANILVWLVEDSAYERSVSWEHSDSKVLKQLKAEAVKRGLPITVPVGDFDDVTGLEISDLWGGFSKPISLASNRYPTDAVLVVRSEDAQLRWTLFDQSASDMLNSEKAPINGSASGSNAAADMVDQISDYYANKNAVMVGEESSQTVMARFDSINDADDFFNLENRLKSLSTVASLDVLKIQGNQVTFNVHLLATESEFEQEVLRISQVRKIVIPEVVEQPQVQSPVVSEPVENGLSAEMTDTDVQTGVVTGVEPDPVIAEPVVPEVHMLRFNWLG